MEMPEAKLQLSSRLRYRAVGQEGVLVDLDSDQVMVVNEVGLHIVKALQHPITRQALIETIVGEFKVSTGIAEADLEHYLQELASQKLLLMQTQPTGN